MTYFDLNDPIWTLILSYFSKKWKFWRFDFSASREHGQGVRRSLAYSISDSESESDSDSLLTFNYLPQKPHSQQNFSKLSKNSVISRPEQTRGPPTGPTAHRPSFNSENFDSENPEDIYVRLASQNSKHKKRKVSSIRPRDHFSRDQHPDRRPRPIYNQSIYGQFRRVPHYQSFPNYPRYRSQGPPRRPSFAPGLSTYLILAFILFCLMLISLIPVFS